MDNYDQMVTKNRKISEEKANRAITAMNKMFNNDEQVVVCELVKKTGLSRAFFYNNEDVHNELVRLQELQEGKSFVAKQKVVINKAMDKEIELLKKKLAEKDVIIAKQKAEIGKLKKEANAHVLSIIEQL